MSATAMMNGVPDHDDRALLRFAQAGEQERIHCGSRKFHRRRGDLRISNIQFETDRRGVKQVKVCTLLHALWRPAK
jgi:hypothetical protein